MDEGVMSAEELMKQHQRKPGVNVPTFGAKLTEATGTWEEAHDANQRISSLRSSLETSRVCQRSQLSEANWDLERGCAVVTKQCGKHWDVFGRYVDNHLLLLPEEALFLLESNVIEIKLNSISMSIQQSYEVFLGDKCSLSEYRTYSNLNRLGYKVVRHSPESFHNRKRKNHDSLPTSSKRPKETHVVIESDNEDDIEIVSEVNFDRLKALKNLPNLVGQEKAVLEVPKEELLPSGVRPGRSNYIVTMTKDDGGSILGKVVGQASTEPSSLFNSESCEQVGSSGSNSNHIQITRRPFYPANADVAKGKKSRGQKIKNSRKSVVTASKWSKFQWAEKLPEVITLSDDEISNEAPSEVLKTGPLTTLWSTGVNRPLIRPFQATSMQAVLSRLRLFKDSPLKEQGQLLKISYDVYGPNTRFRKSAPGPPNFRVVICDEGDSIPSENDIDTSTLDLENQVPIMFAVVSQSDVAYFNMCPVALPMAL